MDETDFMNFASKESPKNDIEKHAKEVISTINNFFQKMVERTHKEKPNTLNTLQFGLSGNGFLAMLTLQKAQLAYTYDPEVQIILVNFNGNHQYDLIFNNGKFFNSKTGQEFNIHLIESDLDLFKTK